MPQLPLCCACICFFIQVLPINIFGNMNKHSSYKYNVYFSSPTRHNFHFAMRAYATAMMGKNMLRNAECYEPWTNLVEIGRI